MTGSHRTGAIDYIVVGQGLAGSCLALQLLWQNKSVVVFDQPGLNHCTQVAAGLFNPITGRMLAKSWQADLLFPYLYSFYTRAESHLKNKFFYPRPLYRPFISAEEQNEWMGWSTHAALKNYIENIYLKPVFSQDVNDPLGGVLLKQGGHVDAPRFVESVRNLLSGKGSFRDEKFEDHDLREEGNTILYHGYTARKVIYCRGVSDLESRFFSWLPIKPLKGETISVRMSPVERIYNRGVYLVPTNSPGEYRVGATYDFDLTPSITTSGKRELEGKLKELICLPYSISNQNWGIRPTTPDRRILLGSHPSSPNIVIFNGLGTKGISLAPYYSGMLVEWLAGGREIAPEVNIQRYKSLYFEV